MNILSWKDQPQVESPKETWNAAMAFFMPDERGYLANRAAHGWTIIEEDEGLIAIVFYDPVYHQKPCGEMMDRHGPDHFSHTYMDEKTLARFTAFLQKRLDNT